MADTLKQIASASAEAVQVAINSVLVDQDARRQFEENLKSIADLLVTPSTKKRKRGGCTIPSDKVLFTGKIIPQIRQAVDRYDDSVSKSVDVKWKVHFSFVQKFNNERLASLADMVSVHKELIEQERIVTNFHLVIAYHRGLLYIKARKLVEDDEKIREFFSHKFGLAYATVRRYGLFAELIQAYPRLLVCDLTFTLFTKYHNQILTYLNTDVDLAHKLRAHVTFDAQDAAIDISPAEGTTVSQADFKLVTDPKYVYEDDDWYDDEERDSPDENASAEAYSEADVVANMGALSV